MAEAGWFPDPHNPGQLRYWDGSTWTEHIHVPETVAAPPPFAPSQGQSQSQGQNPPPPGGPTGTPRINDIGEWIRESFKVAWRTLVPVGKLLVIGGLPMLVAFLIGGVGVFSLRSDSATSGIGAVPILLFVIAALVFIAAAVWMVIATLGAYYMLYEAHYQRPVSVGDALMVGRRNIWRLIGAYLIMAAVGLAALAVVGLIVGGLYLAIGEAAFLLLILVYFGWIAFSFWLQVKLPFVPVAAAVSPPGTQLIRTSMGLSDGRFWPTLGRVFLLGIIASAAMWPIQIVISLGVPLLVSSAESTGGGPSVAVVVVVGLLLVALFVVAIMLMQIFVVSGTTRLYADLGGPAVSPAA